jgi:hypothetical protein
MGDRVLLQCVAGHGTAKQDVGPVLYLHWDGDKAPDVVAALAERMKVRGSVGDVTYCSARLVEAALDACGLRLRGKDAGIGMWNQDTPLTAEDSQGDAGCVLIHVDKKFRCDCMGGYLVVGANGFPAMGGV